MDDAYPAQPAPHHHESHVVQAIERKLSPGILLIIAILAMVFFIFGLLNLLIQSLLRLRRARRRRRRVGDVDGSPTAFQGQLGQLFHLHDAGVDQAFIDALPVFPYHAVAAGRAAAACKSDPFDCAVCICEFEMEDKLRLLPTCGHAFHVPCIDAWLLSHSTCPLCRGSILADECSPESSPFVLVLDSERDGRRDPGDSGESEESPPPKAEEEIVEVKLGKFRCVDGNVSARDFAVDGTSSSRGNLGQRRCLSMGSYEYVMDDHAALRVTVKTTPKRRPGSSRSSRRRHAMSECDFKKGAWEAAVTEAAAASAGTGGAASLDRDSFSVSKIWMVSSRNENATRTAELAGERRAVSFRWPAMADGWKKHVRGEASWDVEAAVSRSDNGAPSLTLAEERPSIATTVLIAGGREQSSKGGGSHP